MMLDVNIFGFILFNRIILSLFNFLHCRVRLMQTSSRTCRVGLGSLRNMIFILLAFDS